MAENEKWIARVPVVPDDFDNKDEHKLHEIVMDFKTNDIYEKEEDGYVNITGRIKESIKDIQDGSVVVHIVTEDTLPPIKDRPENHWYYVITRSIDASRGTSIQHTSYIYYGLISNYSRDKNHVLIAQNMIDGPGAVKIKVVEDYMPCFYVPITMNASFKDITGSVEKEIDYEIVDRIYALNGAMGTYVAYDVYVLDITAVGEYNIDVNTSGSEMFTISFDANITVAGLQLPDPIGIDDGDSIGDMLPKEPVKTDPRYNFEGWSLSKLAPVIIDRTYKPEGNITLYAFYTYVSDPTMYTYYSTYVSTTGKQIGTYCSTVAKDQIVFPEKFPGYKEPEGQAVTYDGIELEFVYEPYIYNITYDFDGGHFDEGVIYKNTYTVEDRYFPPVPSYEDHTFLGWTPRGIEKSVEDITFKASWESYAILKDGNKLKSAISSICDIKAVTGIQIATKEPEKIDLIDVSCTDIPIYAWYTDGIIMLLCVRDIWCNMDMSNAFEGFELLRDIDDLRLLRTKSGMNVSYMFKDCKLLSDASAVEDWANGEFSNITDTFANTPALEAGRVPSWYKWTVTVNYNSTSLGGKLIETTTRSCVPGETIYSKNIDGYTAKTRSLVIDSKDKTYNFDYDPIEYTISYETYGGEIIDPKTKYTIEDNDYIPQDPIRPGYTFVGWNPTMIHHGDYGDVTFIAQYDVEE